MSFMSDHRNHRVNIKDKQEKLSRTSPGKEVGKIGEISEENIEAMTKVSCVIIPFVDTRGAREFMKIYDLSHINHAILEDVSGKKLKELMKQCQNYQT